MTQVERKMLKMASQKTVGFLGAAAVHKDHAISFRIRDFETSDQL